MSNYTDFERAYAPSEERVHGEAIIKPHGQAHENLINRFGGLTFNQGVYKIFGSEDVQTYTELAFKLFPEYKGAIMVFASDWLGRLFALDLRRNDQDPTILMLETGIGEAMQIPVGIEEFHNVDLVQYADDALAYQFYLQWRAKNPNSAISYEECVGYKVPLFLGGSDTLDNLELIEQKFYTEVCGQLRQQALHLGEGQTIGSVKIS